MSKLGRIFCNNYDFIYVPIIFIDRLACDGYIEIRNTAEHYEIHISEKKNFFFFFFFFTESDIKHELSRCKAWNVKPLSGNI